MDKIPTAEEFLQDHYQISHFYDDKTDKMVCFSDDVKQAMIEFAKLHVKAALEEVHKSDGLYIELAEGLDEISSASLEDVLDIYPEENIK